MHVLHVSAECAPWAKAGGLADVVGALPRWLPRADGASRASVLIPRYGHLAEIPATRIARDAVRVDPRELAHQTLRAAPDVAPFPLLFADHAVFHEGGIHAPSGQLERQAVLSHAAARLIAAANEGRAGDLPPVDVVHLHDHHVSFASVWIAHGTFGPRAPTVFTAHAARYSGPLDWAAVEALDLPPDLDRGSCDHDARYNSAKAALLHATRATTVSPTHADELRTEPHASHGLDYAFRMMGDRFRGILNGIDTDAWDPASDPVLEAPYDADDPSGKAATRAVMCREHDLDPARPLMVFVGRLVPEKGVDQILDALPRLAISEPDAQTIVLGSGEPRYHEALAGLERTLAGRVRVALRHDEALAHRLYAAADILLMPSWYEPCGLSQMYALRYGAIPLVYPTGGLRDSVVAFDPARGTGTGVLMDAHDGPALERAARTALGIWRDETARRAIMRNGMTTDVSWRRSASEYARLYAEALRAGGVRA